MARLGRRNLMLMIVAFAVLLLAYAWVNGGQERPHEMTAEVTAPEASK